MDKPGLLQLCPFAPELEAELARDFAVTRLFAPGDAEIADGTSIRAIATGGHIGAPGALIERLPNLGIIAINGVGYDKVDLDLARRRGIRVTTTPGVLTDDVADAAVGLVIALFRRLPAADAHVRAGAWPTASFPLARRLSGSRFGIVGLGSIGAAIAHRLSAFGPVAYTGPRAKPLPYRFVPDLRTLAGEVDVLVLTALADSSTRHMVDASVLDALGPRGCLINVARGSLVDEEALVAALAAGRLGGAGLDVFADEPHVPAGLLTMPNVVLTPHIGSATVESRRQMAELVLANLRAFVDGAPLPTALV